MATTNGPGSDNHACSPQINAHDLLVAAFNSIYLLVAHLDTEMNFLLVNRAYAQADNKDPDDFVGKNHFDLYPNAENEAIFKQVLTSGEPYSALARPFEYPRNPERGVSHWDWSLYPIKDSTGQVTSLVLILLDVTDRIQAIEQAQTAEARFRSLVEATTDWIWEVDTDGIFTYASPKVTDLLGYTPQEVIGRSAFDLMPPKEAARVQDIYTALIAGRQPFNRLLNINQHKDGHEVILETSGMPLFDSQGNWIGYRGIDRDITERREMEYALVEAERISHEKSRFLSRMSHEVRTPLNAILGFAQLLAMDDTLSDDQRNTVEEIVGAGKLLRELVNDVLDLSQIEAGKLQLDLRPLALADVVDNSVSLVNGLARTSNVTIHVALNNASRSVVLADATRLKQVIINLLSNAIKYNKRNGLINISASTPQSDRIRLTISDTGIGIAPEHMPRLFAPFERLGQSELIEGAGMGLAISKQLTEMMGGELGALSSPGQGSQFWIELPAA